MAYNRIGFGTDFVLKNGNIGIGTEFPTAKLQVAGTIKGEFIVSGEGFFDVYEGYTPQKQNVSETTTVGIATVGVGTFAQSHETETGNLDLVGQFNTVSEDIIVDEGKIFEITTTNITGITTLGTQEVYAPDPSVVSVGTLESVSIQSHFSVPDGGISERVDNPIEGSVRFNDDLNTLEFYNGVEWRQFTVTGASGRGVFGSNGKYGYVNINTLGNAEYFGDAFANAEIHGAFGSETRGVWGGGYGVTSIEYLTLASSGNAISFGSLTAGYFRNSGGCSSSTRGLFFGGGLPAYYNVIEYIEIQTTGNALDFGDQSNSSAVRTCFSSPTRGFSIGGYSGAFEASLSSTIDSVTISSKGDATEFGDIKQRKIGMAGFSNNVRGVFGGGYNPPSYNTKNLEYITMSSNGNSIDFGDLSQGRTYPGGTATQTRGIIFGGALVPGGPVNLNTIDYITIASTGNAQDFGDYIKLQTRMRGTSDSHGGLGGF